MKHQILTNRNLYNFTVFIGFAYVFISYSFYFNYLDWSGDYALYIMQAKISSQAALEELLSKMNSSLTISQNANSFSPQYYPWGLPLIFKSTAIFHSWDIKFIKLINPITLFIIFLFLINLKKNSENRNYLIPLIFLFLVNNLLFFSSIQPSLISSFCVVLSYYFFDKKNIKLSLVFFFLALLIRTNVIFFAFYFIINQSLKKNFQYFTRLIFLCSPLFFFFQYFIGISIFGNYNFEALYISQNNLFEFNNLYNSVVDFLIKTSDLIFHEANSISTYLGLLFYIIVFLLAVKNKSYFVVILFGFVMFFIDYFLYPLDVKRVLTPMLIIFCYFLSQEILSKKINIFVIIFLIFNIFQSLTYIQNFDFSSNVFDKDYDEIISLINKDYSNQNVAFHKPRVLMMDTQVLSYRVTNENTQDILSSGLLLCDKSYMNCPNEVSELKFLKIFENETFKLFKINE